MRRSANDEDDTHNLCRECCILKGNCADVRQGVIIFEVEGRLSMSSMQHDTDSPSFAPVYRLRGAVSWLVERLFDPKLGESVGKLIWAELF